MSQEVHSTTNTPKIILFGQTGAGKSSLINMLAGKNVARVSSDPYGTTTAPESYDIPNENKTYTFFDTCGLNEGEKGSVPAREAANNLINFLNGVSVSLIIYVARGNRFLNEVGVNCDLFRQIRSSCGEKVPAILVVTGLEQEEVMDKWWTTNKVKVKGLKLSFKGHACVTTIQNSTYAQEYQDSKNKVWKLVEEHCNSSYNNPPFGEASSRNGHKSSQNIIPSGGVGPKKSSHNIILFGASGAGKSSIVNMIVGQPVAKVSDSPVGCTFQHERYETTIGDTHFNVYDTVGLNEGDQGHVPNWKAIRELYTLIRCLDGVSLLIYCMRGRIKENALANWILFHKVLCAKKVPIIAVETGLEHEGDLEGRRVLLKDTLETYGMVPKNVACIVGVEGRKKEYLERYNWSRTHLRELIINSYRRKPWSTTTDDWIGQIYKTTYSTKLCLFSDAQLELAGEGNVVDEFIKETGMGADEVAQLKSTLLDAETKLRKRR